MKLINNKLILMRTLDNIDIAGKFVLLRADLNSPLEDGKITINPRILAHSKTIKKLSERDSKLVVLSHQGRAGEEDFISLEQHAKLLGELINKPVLFVKDTVTTHAKSAIKNLKDGEILLLENVRMLDDEEKHDGQIVKELSPLFDYFVLDALSVSHRKHASVVGFMKTLPSFAGNVLYEELNAIKTIQHKSDVVFFFGGSKVHDSFSVMKNWLEEGKAKSILVGGALSILFLHAKGYDVSKSIHYLKENELLDCLAEAKNILEKFEHKIILPVDVAFSINGERFEFDVQMLNTLNEEGDIFDIGTKTIEKYSLVLKEAYAIIANGPAGVYEIEKFSYGTKNILNAIAQSSAFSLLGGGHTITAIEKFGIDKKKFGYVSLSGKALIEFLSGKSLPAIEMLEENWRKF